MPIFPCCSGCRRPRCAISARFDEAGTDAEVAIENTGAALAFQVHLELLDGANKKEILPVYWDDDFELMPGERRSVHVNHAASQLPRVVVADAWNALPVRAASAARAARGPGRPLGAGTAAQERAVRAAFARASGAVHKRSRWLPTAAACALLVLARLAPVAAQAEPGDDQYRFLPGTHEMHTVSIETGGRGLRLRWPDLDASTCDAALLGVRVRASGAEPYVEVTVADARGRQHLDAAANGQRWLNLTSLRGALRPGAVLELQLRRRRPRAPSRRPCASIRAESSARAPSW